MKVDKTDLYNLLVTIAAIILAGGDLASFEMPEAIPEWGWPIIIFVTIAINFFSRDQVKTEKDISDDLLERWEALAEKEKELPDRS